MKQILPVGLFTLLSLGGLRAQSPSHYASAAAGNGRIYDLGSGITPPRLLSSVEPHSAAPPNLHPHGRFDGTTIVALVVDSNGHTRDVRVARSAAVDTATKEQWLGQELDQEAVKRMQALVFEPAMRHGEPVSVRVRIETSWHLKAEK